MSRELLIARKAITATRTRDELRGVFRQALAPHGFTASAIGYAPGPMQTVARDPFLLLDWPREWLELYARMGFASDDIVIDHARTTREPFTWGEVRLKHPGASAAIFEAARGFGWEDGFVVPVHDRHGGEGERAGIVSLAATRRLALDRPTARQLLILALAAFAHARRLRDGEVASDASGGLTRREREVLALVAEGLSDAEIGARLDLKAATAHFHVEQAKRRLGATTRAQAVATALRRSLI